jgi:phage terminase small subunit
MSSKKTQSQKQLEGTERPDRLPGSDQIPVLDAIENPAPELYACMSPRAKKLYTQMGAELVKTGKLTRLDLPALVTMANALEQLIWASNEMRKLNGKKMGTGFIQTYKTGAKNITAELAMYRSSVAEFQKIAKQFGLSFSDRQGIAPFLETGADPNQTSIFDFIKNPAGGPLKVVGED